MPYCSTWYLVVIFEGNVFNRPNQILFLLSLFFVENSYVFGCLSERIYVKIKHLVSRKFSFTGEILQHHNYTISGINEKILQMLYQLEHKGKNDTVFEQQRYDKSI